MPELANPLWLLVLVGVAAYLIGAIPFGVVIARVLGLGDLRQIGSGNIGATNVMRTGNKLAGVLTFLLDAGKAALAALVAWTAFGADAGQIAALMAFAGHLYPVYLRFRGGKGVATFIGIALALAWPVGLSVCLIWVLVFLVSRYSSLAALVASAVSPVLLLVWGYPGLMGLFGVMTGMIFLKHAQNIRRLLSGTESRFERKK